MVDNTFENDFELDNEAAAENAENLEEARQAENTELIAGLDAVLSEAAGEPVTVEIVDGDEAGEDDAFFATNAAPEAEAAQAVMDPAKTVTLIPSAGDNKYVQIEEPTPMIEIVVRSGLQFAGDFQCFLNGAQVDLTTLIPGGSTVIIAGKVKGG